MRLALRLHPNSLSFAATQLEVEVARPRSSTLLLSYAVTGRMRDLQRPPVVAATRADELWRHTCFEAFLRTLPGAAYYEFNFAPSTQKPDPSATFNQTLSQLLVSLQTCWTSVAKPDVGTMFTLQSQGQGLIQQGIRPGFVWATGAA